MHLSKDPVDVFGLDRQIDKLIEEMGELTQALLKHRYAKDIKFETNVCEELADVKITLMHIEKQYDADLIKRITEYKLRRLEKMLKRHDKRHDK